MLQLRGRVLQQVHAAQVVLGIARVELQHALDGVVGLDVDGQRLGADDPRHALAARRRRQRPAVLVDAVRVQVVDDPREI